MNKTTDYKLFYEKQIAMRKKYSDRRRVKVELLLEKCIQAGIMVTDSEIDARMKIKK